MVEIALTAALIVGGLALLAYGGDWVVDGGVGLAETLGVTPLVIGVVFLGFATSLPELFTSLQGALQGAPGVALGNVVGSNIANLLLIAGVASALAKTRVRRTMVFRDGGFVLGTSLLLVFCMLSLTEIGFWTGLLLFSVLVIYIVIALRTENRRRVREEKRKERLEQEAARKAALSRVPVAAQPAPDDDDEEEPARLTGLPAFLWFAAGVTATIIGAAMLVEGAVSLAKAQGVSESLIGLTVVAFGTSLPEMAAAIAAGLKRKPELAVGNVLGSNVFNVGAVVGVTAMVAPMQTPPDLLSFDVFAMLGATILMLALAFRNRRLSRGEGLVLLSAYIAYISSTVVRDWPLIPV